MHVFSTHKTYRMSMTHHNLPNLMRAQIPHMLLAAHPCTIMGVETNSIQFYPEASKFEAQFHPGLYQRRNGEVDLSTLRGTGFGYGEGTLKRPLPPAVFG